jgi:hypothetical protein
LKKKQRMKSRVVLLCLFLSAVASAQRYDVLSGNLKNLKGISEYNVTFDYSSLKVHGYETEEAFLQEKMDKRKNVEGKAEQFKEKWFKDREEKYEPKFIEYFNAYFEKGDIKAGKNSNAKYTMNIKTTWIYTGYNVAAVAEPAKISAIVTVFETENPTNELIKIDFDKAIGLTQKQFDFDEGNRIARAYEKLARNIGLQLKRFL